MNNKRMEIPEILNSQQDRNVLLSVTSTNVNTNFHAVCIKTYTRNL